MPDTISEKVLRTISDGFWASLSKLINYGSIL